jgi:hypothetical protein
MGRGRPVLFFSQAALSSWAEEFRRETCPARVECPTMTMRTTCINQFHQSINQISQSINQFKSIQSINLGGPALTHARM